MRKLNWWQAAFVMAIVQTAPGDYRDFEAIKAWVKALGKRLSFLQHPIAMYLFQNPKEEFLCPDIPIVQIQP